MHDVPGARAPNGVAHIAAAPVALAGLSGHPPVTLVPRAIAGLNGVAVITVAQCTSAKLQPYVQPHGIELSPHDSIF